jgi:WD40 repeat protein
MLTFHSTAACLFLFQLGLPAFEPAPTIKRDPKGSLRVDQQGEPLPERAIARLGSVRLRHPGAVHAVAFSDDGKSLAAASDDIAMIRIWERSNGKLLGEWRFSGVMPPSRIAFSPDGKRLYAGGIDRSTRDWAAWDVEQSKSIRDGAQLPKGGRTLALLMPDEEVVIVNAEAFVRWNMRTDKEIARYTRLDGIPETCALLTKRDLVVVIHNDNRFNVWNVTAAKKLWSIDGERIRHTANVPVAISPGGERTAVCSGDGEVHIYDTSNGKQLLKIASDVKNRAASISFSPDGKTIAVNWLGGSLRLYNVATAEERGRSRDVHFAGTSIYFSPDSKSFATGGGNNPHCVRLWDAKTAQRIEQFPGHTSPVQAIAFSPDGKEVTTGSWLRGDRSVITWDAATGKPLRLREAPVGGITGVVYSPEGKHLASCSWGNKGLVRIWDTAGDQMVSEFGGHEAGCTSIAYSPDGRWIASADAYNKPNVGYFGRLRIWDRKSGKLHRQIDETPGAIQRILITPDSRQVVAAADGIHIYDIETGKAGPSFPVRERIWGIALSPDGRLFVSADGRKPAKLWEFATRMELGAIDGTDKVYRAAFAPDSRLVALGGRDAILVHLPSSAIVAHLVEQSAASTEVDFSRNGKWLATAGSAASTATVWDVADLVGKPLVKVKATDAELESWWVSLSAQNPKDAYAAVWKLGGAGDVSLNLFKRVLKPVPAPNADAIATLIANLDAPLFADRIKAVRQIEVLGDLVVEPLRLARKTAKSVEQEQRIDDLLKKLQGPEISLEQLRFIRAVAAIEAIGTEEAKSLLRVLADGAAGSRLSSEAKQALIRLK